ncbi:unnamed protein product [Laminaria digitata]
MALRTRMEEQLVRAERDALVAETERLAAIEREGAAARGAASAVPTTGPGAPTGTSGLSLFCPLTQARPSKFDNVPEHYAIWRSKFWGIHLIAWSLACPQCDRPSTSRGHQCVTGGTNEQAY